MAYAIAAALSLGMVGEAPAQQTPGGAAPAPSPAPEVQQRQDGKGTAPKSTGKVSRKRRGANKTSGKYGAGAKQTSAQPSPQPQR
jgi:hypothetical protein